MSIPDGPKVVEIVVVINVVVLVSGNENVGSVPPVTGLILVADNE